MGLSPMCFGANLGCYPRARSPEAMMFEHLLSVCGCRCGSGAVALIGAVLLLGDGHCR